MVFDRFWGNSKSRGNFLACRLMLMPLQAAFGFVARRRDNLGESRALANAIIKLVGFDISPATALGAHESARTEFLRDWRASRAAAPCDAAMAAVTRAARGADNLVPPILAAVVARATLGEVCDALRGVFGVHRPGDHP